MIDVIKVNAPLMLRLLELAREEIKNDMDLHDVVEIITRISQERVATMDDYDSIVGFMKSQGNDEDEAPEDELDAIKRLGGM
jgi:hypothetical protein